MTGDDPVEKGAQDEQRATEIERLQQELKRSERRAEQLELELLRTREALKTLRSAEQELKTLTQKLEDRNDQAARERQTAREFQERLATMWLPDIDGLAVAVDSRVSQQVGADFYELIEIADGVVCVVIADVAGSGLQATLIMALAKMAFRDAATHYGTPTDILQHVNHQLLDATLERHYLMAFVGILDINLMQLAYVNASHCCPLLLRASDVQPLDSLGLFVGMFEDPHYEQRSIRLTTGDRLFLFSDGFLHALGVDLMNDADRIARIFQDIGDKPVGEIVDGFTHQIGPEIVDDVTLLGIQITREAVPSRSIIIPSNPSELARVEKAIIPILTEKGFSERSLFAIRLGVEEAVINAIKHGNKLDPTKKVKIDFRLEGDQAKIVIADEGPGFQPGTVPDPTAPEYLEREHGRGLMLIHSYMDEVYFNDKGNQITLIKYAPWSSKGQSN
jgi:serine/threonine-protein kinase RsbW